MKLVTTSYPFKELRESGYLYIDKTAYIKMLLECNDNTFFLQRPRRFGKSLLLSTMSSVFRGESGLFDGLALNSSNYDFMKYPVLHFDMTDLLWETTSALKLDLYTRICMQADNSFGLSVENKAEAPATALIKLVTTLKKIADKQKKKTDTQKAVILVDEYDGPILKALSDTEAAMANAAALGDFFSTIKTLNQQGYLRFAFVTGVSKFSMTSIFSGANVFTDLSEDEEYANICGITFDEFKQHLKTPLEDMFAEGLFKRTKFQDYGSFEQALVDMYDGYTWNSIDRIFNPFSLLKAIQNRKLESYWFRSGTPTFLYKYIRSEPEIALNLDEVIMPSKYLEKETAEDLSFEPLLYQSGYLTQAQPVEDGIYTLKVPNIEVREFFEYLIAEAFIGKKIKNYFKFGLSLIKGFQENDADKIQNYLTDLLLSLSLWPKDLEERTFHLFFLVFLKITGIKKEDVYSEPIIETGRPDIAFKLDDKKGILLEFKTFKISHNKSATELETQYGKSLDEAEKQMEKYYEPLFATIKATEIQGIAIAVAWGHGVKVRICRKAVLSS